MNGQDLSMINLYLGKLSESTVYSPQEFLSEALSRLATIGVTFDMPEPKILAQEAGDVFILIDQYPDGVDRETNQLFKKTGVEWYLNLVWVDYGSEKMSMVVTSEEPNLIDEPETPFGKNRNQTNAY